ncbi:hypothetical protein [Actinocorallia herbida]|uniref:hypothetical protein n=1 Tax=Actinocorallia herbida TaxID=58109 RepID=UPI0011CE5C4B|nr:hypothetical protein [Actinocorallia herbida]
MRTPESWIRRAWRLRPPGAASGTVTIAVLAYADATMWDLGAVLLGAALSVVAFVCWVGGLASSKPRILPDDRFIAAALVPLLAFYVLGVALLTDWPTRAATFVSRPFLDRVADTAPSDGPALAGLFYVRSTGSEDGFVWLDTGTIDLDLCDLVRLPPGTDPEDVELTSPPTDYTHLTGPWYSACTF